MTDGKILFWFSHSILPLMSFNIIKYTILLHKMSIGKNKKKITGGEGGLRSRVGHSCPVSLAVRCRNWAWLPLQKMEPRGGFEPPRPCGICLQGRRNQPLCERGKQDGLAWEIQTPVTALRTQQTRSLFEGEEIWRPYLVLPQNPVLERDLC